MAGVGDFTVGSRRILRHPGRRPDPQSYDPNSGWQSLATVLAPSYQRQVKPIHACTDLEKRPKANSGLSHPASVRGHAHFAGTWRRTALRVAPGGLPGAGAHRAARGSRSRPAGGVAWEAARAGAGRTPLEPSRPREGFPRRSALGKVPRPRGEEHVSGAASL